MKNRTGIVIAALAVIAVLAVGGGAYWFLSRDAPDAVDIDSAAESVTTDGETSSVESLDGTWTVDTESGEFDFETATGTFAGFRIAEELASLGSVEAVGRTGEVSGTMTISGSTVESATFEIDMTGITTNEQRRDDRVQSALDTDEFPTATFTLSEPIELPADALDGADVSASTVGELTIHGVSKPATFDLQARLVGSTVVVTGSTDVVFSDFDVEVPSSPAVVSVDDNGTIELQLLLVQG